MHIERKDRTVKPIIDAEHGDVFEYKGMPYIRTNIITSNFGCRKVKCCNLYDGTIEELPEEMVVSVLNARVVIE